MNIEKWDVERDGPLTEEALSRKLEARGYKVSRWLYPPGVSFPNHIHPTQKIDAVFSGKFRLVLGAEEIILESGDCVTIPGGTVHSAEVLGDAPVVSFDGIKG